MRIALIGPCHPLRGGIAHYTASLSHALAERGHETLIISFRRMYPSLLFPGTTQEDTSRAPLRAPSERLLDSLRPRSWRRSAARLVEFQPDAVVIQWWHPFFAPALSGVCRRFRKGASGKVLFLCHNIYAHDLPHVPGASLAAKWMTRRAFRWADGFLVHAEELAEELRGLRPGAPVARIYHPIYDFADSAPSTEVSSVPRLLFFGNVRPYKGAEVFLRALARVKAQLPFRAVIAGEIYGDPKPLKQLAKQLGLTDDELRWEERYIPNEEISSFFRAADLVVLPYLRATQSGIVPLAYRFDVPVVASNVGGLPEVVRDGVTGYLTPCGDDEALADRIVRYFREGRKQEFQTNIREFRGRLGWDQVVQGLLEVIAAAGGQGGRAD
jgi:glycosyltransferase involved in cell wall biosynthesis